MSSKNKNGITLASGVPVPAKHRNVAVRSGVGATIGSVLGAMVAGPVGAVIGGALGGGVGAASGAKVDDAQG
jgi:hypothetical protein